MPERVYPRTEISVRYAGTEAWFTAQHVHTWKRDDAEIQRGMVMSTSGGPKELFRNEVIALFAHSEADMITMLVLNRVPFYVVHKAGASFDLSVPTPRRIELRTSSP
ncbi:MAG TPA: hypothetical protein VFB27_14835 [Opitutaceae bacterium]|nr:hypothetical protein [Opitutaceae bacterium]